MHGSYYGSSKSYTVNIFIKAFTILLLLLLERTNFFQKLHLKVPLQVEPHINPNIQ